MRLRTFLTGLGAALAALAGIFVGLKVARALKPRIGPVAGMGDSWMPAPDAPCAILVELPGSPDPARVELPPEIRADQVEAVRVVPGGEVVIQVKHGVRDRRGMLAGGQG